MTTRSRLGRSLQTERRSRRRIWRNSSRSCWG